MSRLCLLASFAAVICLFVPAAHAADAKVVKLKPGPDAQAEVQEAFIVSDPGTVFEFDAGTYHFTMGLSLDLKDATVRGNGMDKTIFDFKDQNAGSEGLLVTASGVTLENFAIENAKGNCFKSNAANDLKIKKVRTEWTGGPKETNGSYGLYPVSSKNVLIEGCVVKGASDAGIYVGQTTNVIVRHNEVQYNVAGIEIENCHNADVYENTATKNTGGILSFDLPDLPMQQGRDVRIFKNKVFANDTQNFAPKGNIVAKVPTGTGIMILANSNVEIFDNDIRDHGTTNILLISYLTTENKIKDPHYYPFPEGINIHNNTFGPCGNAPGGDGGARVALVAGKPIPDIVWDGVTNSKKLVDGKLPKELGIYIHDNKKDGGEVTFANMGFGEDVDPLKVKVARDLKAHAGTLPAVPPVKMPGVS